VPTVARTFASRPPSNGSNSVPGPQDNTPSAAKASAEGALAGPATHGMVDASFSVTGADEASFEERDRLRQSTSLARNAQATGGQTDAQGSGDGRQPAHRGCAGRKGISKRGHETPERFARAERRPMDGRPGAVRAWVPAFRKEPREGLTGSASRRVQRKSLAKLGVDSVAPDSAPSAPDGVQAVESPHGAAPTAEPVDVSEHVSQLVRLSLEYGCHVSARQWMRWCVLRLNSDGDLLLSYRMNLHAIKTLPSKSCRLRKITHSTCPCRMARAWASWQTTWPLQGPCCQTLAPYRGA
jgi:hypothetical protein